MSLFRLAVLLGKTVSELNMSWREFTYWQAYLAIEPPERAAEVRTAAVLAQITNTAGRSLPKGKKVKPADFLPHKKPPAQSADDQINFMKSLGKANG